MMPHLPLTSAHHTWSQPPRDGHRNAYVFPLDLDGDERIDQVLVHAPVGYRVRSHRGTQFRIWATNGLRRHLVEGYTLNVKRLQAQSEKIQELQQAIGMIDQIADRKALASDEASALSRVIRDDTYGLDLIDAYDHQRVDISEVSEEAGTPIDDQAARKAIDDWRTFYKAGDLFGREKDDSFRGSLANVF